MTRKMRKKQKKERKNVIRFTAMRCIYVAYEKETATATMAKTV